jgi:hypothetical protein
MIRVMRLINVVVFNRVVSARLYTKVCIKIDPV